MTPDPVDAALNVWFGGDAFWRTRDTPIDKDARKAGSGEREALFRARMRRVLDAHDAREREAWNPATSPGHTDMMVPPETLDAFMDANPLPDDDNTLPMEALPEGWWFSLLEGCSDAEERDVFRAVLMEDYSKPGTVTVAAEGPTPRAAMLAAIEAAKEGKS